MFGIGFFELLIICTIALIVLGPKRLPQFITTVEEVIHKIRSATNKVKQEFYSEGFSEKEKDDER